MIKFLEVSELAHRPPFGREYAVRVKLDHPYALPIEDIIHIVIEDKNVYMMKPWESVEQLFYELAYSRLPDDFYPTWGPV